LPLGATGLPTTLGVLRTAVEKLAGPAALGQAAAADGVVAVAADLLPTRGIATSLRRALLRLRAASAVRTPLIALAARVFGDAATAWTAILAFAAATGAVISDAAATAAPLALRAVVADVDFGALAVGADPTRATTIAFVDGFAFQRDSIAIRAVAAHGGG
jgi:hypothetical protein